MDHTYESSTVEMDSTGYTALQDQLKTIKSEKNQARSAAPEAEKPAKPEKQDASSKKFVFKKGDQSVEIEDDYEIEFMADKRPAKLTLRELKDRAAGDIAVKNRMHALAEEKKRVSSTFKEFTDIAKTDPLGALEFISNRARETDSEFEYAKYIEKLAEQAEKIGKMDPKERKAWELEKKLSKAEQDLSQKDREKAVVLRKQEILTDYPEIGDQQFSQMVDAVLSNEELLEGIKDEKGVMDKVEELIQETLTQRDILTVIREINPQHVNDNQLIFSLSDQLRQNPDLDENDVRDIVQQLIGAKEVVKSPSSDRQKDIRTLSNKARQGTPESSIRTQNATPYEILTQKLLEQKKNFSKTPITLR